MSTRALAAQCTTVLVALMLLGAELSRAATMTVPASAELRLEGPPPTALASPFGFLDSCKDCLMIRDLGVMPSGRRAVEITPLNGGLLSGVIVTELHSGLHGRETPPLITPEPATAWLILTAMGLLWRRRRSLSA